MDINRLEYFCAIAKTGSLKEASSLLRISPPALSKAMKVLEDELEVKLLVPSGRGITVTEQGREIALKAEKLISELKNLKSSEQINHAPEKTVRIATFEVFSTHFLAAMIKNGFEDYSFEMHELTPGKMEESILQNTADIGITYLPIPKPNLDFIKAAEIEMGVFGLPRKFKAQAFKDLPFIIPITPVTGSPNKVKGLDGWPDHLAPRKIKYQVTALESALELCRQGVGVAYLPQFIVELHNQTVLPEKRLGAIHFPRLKVSKQPVYLIKRKSDKESATFKKLAKVLRLTCK